MKISLLNNQYFKGHAAGRIKNLYMQNPASESQVNIYNQLRQIGQQEGFGVIMHGDTFVKSDKLDKPNKMLPWGIWSQDNKMFLNKGGKSTIYSYENAREYMKSEAESLAQKIEYPHKKTKSSIDGGSVYFGKKDNGENYMFISQTAVLDNAVLEYARYKIDGNVDEDVITDLCQGLQCKVGDVILNPKEFEKDMEYFVQKALETISSDYDIKPENIIRVPDCDFHIDLFMRPLNYPYVLVNDDKEIDKAIERFKEQYSNSADNKRFFTRVLESCANVQREVYSSSDELCEKLTQEGFIPIKIAGMYGPGAINFMNAVVHETEDGLVYITNGLNTNEDFFKTVQEDFERELLKKCPQIKRVHFITGNNTTSIANEMMTNLEQGHGGIHCMCAEEMME